MPLDDRGRDSTRARAAEDPPGPDELVEELEGQAGRLQEQAAELEALNDELSASEARLRGIIDSSLDAIIATDEESRIIEWNHHAEAIFGWTAKEAIGRSLSDTIIPARYREAHERGVERYLRTGEGPILNRRIEISGVRRSGEEFPVELTVSAARWGVRVVFTSFIRDITDRQRAERRDAARAAATRILAESATGAEAIPRVLQAICEHLQWKMGAFWKMDPAGEVLRPAWVWADPAAGLAPLETATRGRTFAAGEGLPGRVWKGRRPVWISDLEAERNFPRGASAAEAGVHVAFGFPVLVGDDLVGVMEFFDTRPAPVDEALLESMAALGSDVGQFLRRREAERQVEERAEWQRFLARVGTRLAAAAPDYEDTLRRLARLAVPTLGDWCSVFVVDADGETRRLAVAQSQPEQESVAVEISRHGGTPTPDHPVRKVLATGEPALIPEVSDDLLRSAASGPEHLELIRRLGIASLMIVPLEARDRMLGAILIGSTNVARRYGGEDLEIATDFARRAALFLDNARLYRDAQAANQAKAEFLATTSHELRTPLNAVLGYTDLLLQGIPEPIPDSVSEYIRRVSLSAKHLLQLIEEILTYSRLEAGRETVSPEPVDLDVLAEEVRAIMEPLAAEKSLDFHVEVEGSGTVVSDPRKVRQILLNLLSNAVKFTDAGEVYFRARVEDDTLILTVRDTGVGIEAAHLDRIFEPFWQVEQSATRTAQGTGLGLSVTGRLVSLLGGTIEAESEAGRGSTFTVRLPSLPERPAEANDGA